MSQEQQCVLEKLKNEIPIDGAWGVCNIYCINAKSNQMTSIGYKLKVLETERRS